MSFFDKFITAKPQANPNPNLKPKITVTGDSSFDVKTESGGTSIASISGKADFQIYELKDRTFKGKLIETEECDVQYLNYYMKCSHQKTLQVPNNSNQNCDEWFDQLEKCIEES